MQQTIGEVIYEVREHIAQLTLNRPERRNSLGGTLREDIAEAMQRASADAEVRVVILTGAGTSFCAGGDLKELLARAESAEGRSLEDKMNPPRDRTLLAVFETPKPVIAAVNGPALGAGMNLALAADIRLASSTAQFAQTFVKRGMFPDYGGTFLLPRAVGIAKALELIYTGEIIDAAEALRLQLVSRVVPPEQLLDVAWQLARSIAANAPLPQQMAKRAVHQGTEGNVRDALARETAFQNICYDTEDGREGMRAFIEKRPPVFKGR
ncbi:MAG: enoyl-CoA hydratase-related protein [Burkholderiales bacterium]